MSLFSKKLRKASYNGVSFEVTASTLKFGRRVVVHEYPQNDIPYGEDLGRATRIISVSAFIVGADYIARSKRLLEALEKPLYTEPGTLVHPWLGSLKVYLSEKPQVNWNLSQGITTFSLTFVEAGQLNKPSVATSWGNQLRAKVDSFMEETLDKFDLSMNDIEELSANIDAIANGSVEDILGCLSDSNVSKMFDLVDSITNLEATASNLLSLSPKEFGKQLLSALGLGQYVNSVRNWRETTKTLLDVIKQPAFAKSSDKSEGPSSQTTTAFTALETANETVTTFVRQVMLANAVGSASLISSSIDSDTDDEQDVTTQSDIEIRQIRNELLNAIEQEMIYAEADELDIYESLEELYIYTYQTLTNEILQDSELVDVTLPTATPLLVLAYDEYEDASRVDEIARRNQIINPLFACNNLILRKS